MTHGPHELLVRARDVAGNLDATPARHTWTVALPPVVTISGRPRRGDRQHERDVHVHLQRAGLDLQVLARRRDHRLHLAEVVLEPRRRRPPVRRAGDLARRAHEPPVGGVGVDGRRTTVAPITTFHSGPAVTTHDTRAEFTFSANKPNVDLHVLARRSRAEPCTSPLVLPAAARRRAQARGRRRSRRRCSTASACRSSRTTTRSPRSTSGRSSTRRRPNASIDWGPRATTASLIAVFGLSSDDPTAILECSLDGGGFNECEPVDRVHRPRRAARTRSRCAPATSSATSTSRRRPTTGRSPQPGPPNTPVGTNVTVTLPMPDGPGNATVNFFDVNSAGTTTVDALTGGPELPAGYTHGRRPLLRRRHDRRLRRAGHALPRLRPRALPDDRRPPAAGRRHDLDRRHDDEQPVHREDLREPRRTSAAASPALFAIAAANTGIAPHVSILSGPPFLSQQRHGDVRAVGRHARRPDPVLARRPAVRALLVARSPTRTSRRATTTSRSRR